MTTVRTAAKRRKTACLHYFTLTHYAALSRETGISVDLLRTLAGISDPLNAHQFTVAAFHSRGERAWQKYRRDGIARPIDTVFDALAARFEAARARFEPPNVKLGLRSADLGEESSHLTPADGSVFSDLGFPADEAQALLQAADAGRQP